MAELLGIGFFIALVFAISFKQELRALNLDLQYAYSECNSLREDLRIANEKINSLENDLKSAKAYGDQVFAEWRREVGASKL